MEPPAGIRRLRSMRLRGWQWPALVLAIAIPLGGCRYFGTLSGPSSVPSATPGAPVVHPSGDGLVLRLTDAGGFVPADYQFSALPTFTLVGDGRVIIQGAQDMIYPGPALPPILVRRLTEDGIQAVLRAALDTGQLGEDATWTGANATVADASTAVFTLHADGRAVTVSVYALGIVDGRSVPGMSEAERAARASLADLASLLENPDGWLPAGSWADPGWTPFTPDALRLLVRVAPNEEADPNGLPPQLLPWPMAKDPATFGSVVGWYPDARCGVVAGADAQAWLDALSQANQLTRWTRDDRHYAVSVRPLLPDEPRSCDLPD